MATSTLGSGTLVLAGTTSGTTTVTATAVAGTTTLTLPAATDTLVGKATTDTLTNKTLTGAVMNGTLGATTPSTVAATTLTTSSTVTHNGGTANGVAYLDGSKVLTTGSALTFSGSALAVTGTLSTTSTTTVAAASGGQFFKLEPNTGLTGIRRTWAFNPEFSASGQLSVMVGASEGAAPSIEVLKLTSTSLAVTGSISSTGGFTSNTTITAQLDGSDSAGAGPGFNLFNTAFNRGWRTQLSASNNKVDYYFNGAAYVAATTLDTSGNLLVGTTAQISGTTSRVNILNVNEGLSGLTIGNAGGSGNTNCILFVNSNGIVGTIRTNASATAYNTSSDYRLKENVAPMAGALAKVLELNPVTYTWKTDGSAGEGFVAHELAEVCPHAVTGEKDAVDEEGNPQYQGIDTSFLVATLTAAIQEQQALITQLQADVAALKGA